MDVKIKLRDNSKQQQTSIVSIANLTSLKDILVRVTRKEKELCWRLGIVAILSGRVYLKQKNPGMLAHAFNSSTQKTDMDHCELGASLVSIVVSGPPRSTY